MSLQTSQYSKLEKADILEMTVKHLRSIQHQQLALAAAADSTVVSKYRAGFSECAQEVTRYLSQVEGLHPEARGKLEYHLQNCLQRSQGTETHHSQAQGYSHPANQQLHVGIPAATPLTTLPGITTQTMQQIPVINAQGVPQFFGALQMVPGTVMASDVTLLLPTSQMCTTMTSPTTKNQSGSTSVSPASTRSSPSSTVSRDSSSCSSTSSSVSHDHGASDVTAHHITSSKNWPQMAPVQHVPANVQFKEEKVWRPW